MTTQDQAGRVAEELESPSPAGQPETVPTTGVSASDAADERTVPVVIFIPGLGQRALNSADAVADVVASCLDTRDPGQTYGVVAPLGVPTPHGLTLSKKIVDGAKQEVVQFFQFSYSAALQPAAETAPATPTVVPGAVRSATFAVWGGLKWWAALGRKSKTRNTKVQLLLGLIACGVLLFAALVSLWALLVALGVDLPWVDQVLDVTVDPGWTFGITALGLTASWAVLRKRILSMAATIERLVIFVRDHEGVASSIAVQLDQAVDRLHDSGWKGPIHLLGYSFGSLVVFESMFPRETALRNKESAQAVTSLVTIGCPLDLVRLYVPDYVEGRAARKESVPWTNVFNAADIFASNFQESDDQGEGSVAPSSSSPSILKTAAPRSIRYTSETIGLFQIFVSGRTHSGYWGRASSTSCFDPLVAELALTRTR